jgi:MoxR-like ATPase
MSEGAEFRFYAGDGTTMTERGVRPSSFSDLTLADGPEGYIAERGLSDAVNVALMLGQPLLVTGEPGTGKTQLAHSIAHELELPAPFTFHTKTTSTAKDLFYRYDALSHFRDAQLQPAGTAISAEKYITYEALGLAILLSQTPPEADAYLPPELQNRGPARSVVLLDEIDKAPRDLPNDVLNEIEYLSFHVRETGRSFAVNPEYRPVVILTSNSEKNLPDPFLRRCVFYHIAFPDKERLRKIVGQRLRLTTGFTEQMLDKALSHFIAIRQLDKLRKKPATAELLAWLRILEQGGLDVSDASRADELAFSYSTLVKSREDIELLRTSPIERRDA